jgi:cell division protein DivIC
MEPARKRKITQIHSEYAEHESEKLVKTNTKLMYLKRRLIALVILMTLFTVPMLIMMHNQESKIAVQLKEKEEVAAQLASLQKEQQQLQQEVVKLNDYQYIAELARRDLFLSSEGEKVFITPPSSN